MAEFKTNTLYYEIRNGFYKTAKLFTIPDGEPVVNIPVGIIYEKKLIKILTPGASAGTAMGEEVRLVKFKKVRKKLIPKKMQNKVPMQQRIYV